MEVIYVVVSRGTTVLCEYTRHSGNFETVTRLILSRIEGSRLAQIKYDDHTFHYKQERGLTFMCMTDESARTRLPVAFLDDVAETFFARYGDTEARAFELSDFVPVLRQKCENFTNDLIGQVKAKIDDTRDVLVESIDMMLERGERIELLVDKTQAMSEQAFRFERSATRLKDSLCWKRVKIALFLVFVILLFAFFIAVFACGLDFKKCA